MQRNFVRKKTRGLLGSSSPCYFISLHRSRDLLPLPKDLLSMFADEEAEADDNKDLHMGRTRTFEHVAGNWATYLYIPRESAVY